MTFPKPDDIKYTDMCIYIDKTIYKDGGMTEEEQNQVYVYLYHIVHVLACKKRYFSNFDDYDTFSLDTACNIYNRITNPRQFTEEDGVKPLPKVKSILNYIKNVLYGNKVDWQKDNYSQVLDARYIKSFNPDNFTFILGDTIAEKYRGGLVESLEEEVRALPNIVREIVYNTHYRNDKVMLKNIYNSIMITLNKYFTLSNHNKIILQKRMKKGYDYDSVLRTLFEYEKKDSVTLWHLDNSFKYYIQVLANLSILRLKMIINELQQDYKISDDTLKMILSSARTDIIDKETNDEY